ncbi:MAG: Gfo/Idh/MocA family oxidoreductase [Verrucomicrobiae bacterium]|nr:Gfo/Idh/MocA family oxidoreductase [Verrucomicrobiae bacterium]
MTEKQKLNVAIVGCGFMGLTHIKAYLKIAEAHIAAICDAVRLPEDGDFSGIQGNVGDGQAVRLDMSRTKATRDFRELLADPGVDLIDICVPTHLHPEIAVEALKAGKHVICEKPMARTSALCRQMIDAAAASRGFLMPAMCIRFWPEWAWLKNAIAAGTYGRVLAARFRRVAEPPGWGNFMDGSKSGGALLDLHIHDTDFVQFCFGKPSAVYSRGYSKISGAIDHVVTQYEVASGAAVHAEGGWAMTKGFGFSMSYTVNFERATADYDMSRGPDALKLFVEGRDPQAIACTGPDGYESELRHAIGAALAGSRPTIVTANDGLAAVQICEAEEESVRSGRLVRVA